MNVPILLIATLLTASLLTPAAATGQTEVSEADSSYTESLTPDSQSLHSALAQEILLLTNTQRVHHGLAPLIPEPNLAKAATDHSREMRSLNYFSHTSPVSGRATPRLRVNKYGLNPRMVAENIYECSGYQIEQTARSAVDAFMQSPGHRENILSSRSTHIGIGFVEVNGTVSVTQVFAGGL